MIYLLDHDWNGILKENKQIECVVNNANDFCKAYADEHYKLGDSEAAIKEVKQKAKKKLKKQKLKKKAEKEKPKRRRRRRRRRKRREGES